MSKFSEKRYVKVSREVKFEGEVIRVAVDKVRMPHGEIVEREVVEHLGAVGMVAVDEEDEVILVRQYRHPVKEGLLEIPAGKLRKEEVPLECAKRELVEETGFEAKEFVKLAEFYTTPGYSNEFFYLYLAKDLVKKEARRKKDEELELEVIKIPLKTSLDMISKGEIKDGKTIAGLCLAYNYLESR